MAHHRVSHTATVLEDGRVLIVGGFDYGQDRPPSRETAEIPDPTTGSFASAGPLADVAIWAIRRRAWPMAACRGRRHQSGPEPGRA